MLNEKEKFVNDLLNGIAALDDEQRAQSLALDAIKRIVELGMVVKENAKME